MGIALSSNFDLSAQLPLDARQVAVTTVARDAIPSVERYDGLSVYVLADSKTYQLRGGIDNIDWVEDTFEDYLGVPGVDGYVLSSLIDGTRSWIEMSAGTTYTFQHSLTETTGTVNLVNDSASPGNSKLYGTNGSGTRGWYDIPAAMVYPTGSGIPIVVSGASWGTTITDNSANWNTAYGWGNHSGLYLPLAGGTMSGNITMGNGGTIGQAAGPLLTFDDTNNYLEITGCSVGIGTTSPNSGSKVDIRGKLAINPTVTAASALHVQAESGNTNLARFWNSDYASGVGSGVRMFTGAATGNTYTAIQAYQAGASATNNFILQSVGGNVGIGTTAPSHTLDVNGSFRSTLQPQANLNSNETIDNTNYQTYAGKIVYVNGEYTIIIASTCPVGFHATFIRNAAGEVTFAGGTSPATVTIYSSGNKKRIDVRYEAAYIHMYSSASCYLTGALKT